MEEKEKLKFEEPTCEVVTLEQEDVITASGEKGTTIFW